MMKSLNELIMDSLEERIKQLRAAAKDLADRVEEYTAQKCSRSILLLAKDRLRQVLKE